MDTDPFPFDDNEDDFLIKACQAIESGEMFTDDLVFRLVKSKLSDYHCHGIVIFKMKLVPRD